MKVDNLKVNDEFYAVGKYVGLNRPSLNTFKVLEVRHYINDKTKEIETDVKAWGNGQKFWRHQYDYVGQSLEKANRVLEHKIIKHLKLLKHREYEKQCYKENELNLEDAKEKYIDKEIMIKFRGYPSKVSKYIKVDIRNVSSTYKKGVYNLHTRYNRYLTSRENNNWYFWSKLDELKRQREELNKEIRKARLVEKAIGGQNE